MNPNSDNEHYDRMQIINMNFAIKRGQSENAFSALPNVSKMGVAKARMYDPIMGQFISVDPLADKYPGWGPYVYCMNNPVMLTDPSGESFLVALAIFSGFRYLKTAYDNRDRENGKWAWAPGAWSKDGTYVVGLNTNSDFSNITGSAGMGYGGNMFGVSYNNNQGYGFGYYDEAGNGHFNYQREISQTPETKAARNYEAARYSNSYQTKIFVNQSETYDYMWNNSFDQFGNPRVEISAWKTSIGFVVMPFYKNTLKESNNGLIESKWIGGKFNIKINNRFYQVTGHVHTHPDYNNGKMGALGLDFENQMKVPMFILWDHLAWPFNNQNNLPSDW